VVNIPHQLCITGKEQLSYPRRVREGGQKKRRAVFFHQKRKREKESTTKFSSEKGTSSVAGWSGKEGNSSTQSRGGVSIRLSRRRKGRRDAHSFGEVEGVSA